MQNQASKHILAVGESAERLTELLMELSKAMGGGKHQCIVGLDALSDNSQAEVESVFDELNSVIDMFIVDARPAEPAEGGHIWDTPIDEWTPQAEAGKDRQTRVMRQIQMLLRCRLKRKLPPWPFAVVIIGRTDALGSSPETILSKLQRDVAIMSPEATAGFLSVENPAGEEMSSSDVARAILAVVGARSRTVVTSVGAMLHHPAPPLSPPAAPRSDSLTTGPRPTLPPPRPHRTARLRVALSFDFDALAGHLGTGDSAANTLSDYSAGVFAGRVGAPRLLRMLRRHGVADRVTWFVPAHTMETFPDAVADIVRSGAEVALHGYAHEGASQLTAAQQRDVIRRCVEVHGRATGKKKVRGWRAPLYDVGEGTLAALRDEGFLYDSSLAHHDSQPYFAPGPDTPPVRRIDFSGPASGWMKPTPLPDLDEPPADGSRPLVEVPTGWNNEDMMALQFLPHVVNSNGQVAARVVEERWRDMFLWLLENGGDESDDGTAIFPLLMHPDTSGLSHVIAMADRMVAWLRSWGDVVEFWTHEMIAEDYLRKKGVKSW